MADARNPAARSQDPQDARDQRSGSPEAENPDPRNRDQRRDDRFGREHTERVEPQAEQQERKLIQGRTPPDVTSVRAKSQGHGKKTADKWNQ